MFSAMFIEINDIHLLGQFAGGAASPPCLGIVMRLMYVFLNVLVRRGGWKRCD